jgi:predicted ATPase
MRVTRLKVLRWRNFMDAELHLSERAFIVGPNAAGKSNLVDALRFLRDIAETGGGGFQAAVRRRGGTSAIRSLAAGRMPTVMIEVDIGDQITPNLWSYKIGFTQDNNRRPIIESEVVTHKGLLILNRLDNEDRSDPARRSQTHLEQINQNKNFRELAEFFSSIRYLHIVPQLIREPDRSVGRRNDPYGGDFIERIASTPEKARKSRLRKITEALRIAVPHFSEIDLQQDLKGFWHLKAKYVHWRAKGAWQNEDQFSDGTLRLLGLLWSLFEGAGPILLEEPELSLHSEVVRYIPAMFSRMQLRRERQVIVTTHSDVILSDPSIGLDEVHIVQATEKGSIVLTASRLSDVKLLLDSGVPLDEAIRPLTRPKDTNELSLFDVA